MQSSRSEFSSYSYYVLLNGLLQSALTPLDAKINSLQMSLKSTPKPTLRSYMISGLHNITSSATLLMTYKMLDDHMANPFVAGAVSGVMRAGIMEPLSWLRMQWQIDPSLSLTALKAQLPDSPAAKARMLWKGGPFGMARDASYNATYFLIFDAIKHYIPQENLFSNILAGGLAGSTGASVSYWFDVAAKHHRLGTPFMKIEWVQSARGILPMLLRMQVAGMLMASAELATGAKKISRTAEVADASPCEGIQPAYKVASILRECAELEPERHLKALARLNSPFL